MKIPYSINLNKKLIGLSICEYVMCDNKYLAEKYIKNPKSRELAINKIPLEEDVPKNTSKFLSVKISDEINTNLSKTSYKLSVIELKRVLKISLIVFKIVCVISWFESNKNTSL